MESIFSPDTDAFVLAYATIGSMAEAQDLAKILVEERLVACVNILPQMTSIYSWKGQLETSQEVVMLFKTLKSRCPELEARYSALHPYEVPCLVFFPLVGGHAPYLQWLAANCR
jgi:periplasmic divalent cation tolerance protein